MHIGSLEAARNGRICLKRGTKEVKNSGLVKLFKDMNEESFVVRGAMDQQAQPLVEAQTSATGCSCQ